MSAPSKAPQIKRRVRGWMLLVLFCLSLAAGMQISQKLPEWLRPKPDEVSSRYLAAWKQGDYSRMYACLSLKSQMEYSLEAFSKLHDDTFRPMEISRLSFTEKAPVYDANHWVAAYHMVLSSSAYGDMVIENQQLPILHEKGGWRIDFSPKILLPNMQKGDKIRVINLAPRRGDIATIDGVLLATSSFAESIYAIPEKIKDKTTFATQVGQLLRLPPASILQNLNSKKAIRDGFVVLQAFPKGTVPDDVRAAVPSIVGLGIDNHAYTPLRIYPQGDMLCHALGFMGYIPKEQMGKWQAKGYLADERIGISGIESKWEDVLHGKLGYRLVRVNDQGDVKQIYIEKKPQNGEDVVLSINGKLQQRADTLLRTKLLPDQMGTILVLEPSTGRVQAMANAPDYDNNLFSWPMQKQTWDRLNNDPKKPLFGRATSALYPPGSSFKPFTAAMALQNGLVTTATTFTEKVVNLKWRPNMKGWVYPSITRHLYVPPPVNMHSAMTYSDNIYFAWLAMKIGGESFVSFAERLGMGESLPFDLPVAKAQVANHLPLKDLKLLADSGYGQGELLCSPLQMAVNFSAFANHGNLMQPTLAQKLCHMQGNDYVTSQEITPKVWKQNILSQDLISTIQPLLHNVCIEGTGKTIGLKNISGKTGTAEVGPNNSRIVAWFIGFIDDGSQDKLVLVMIEAKEKGGGGRYELAREMFKP